MPTIVSDVKPPRPHRATAPWDGESIADLRARFADDGVVHVRRALDEHTMRLVHDAFQWSVDHPGPGAREVLKGSPGAFYQDHANPNAFREYEGLLCESTLPDLICALLGSEGLWLLYEQIWLKQGGDTLRTPWHQDLPYIPLQGDHLATAWINLDPVERHQSLEFVRGSHRGPLYNPTAFDATDPSASMFADGVWPALPDIEAHRDAWPIVSSQIEPGDIVVFHPAILHGGAPTVAGQRRRTLSLRFFGDHAFCAERPQMGLHEVDQLTTDDGTCDPMLAMARMPPGSLFRHPGFHKLR